MKSGYLYVLVHPSDPDLYKVGQTTRLPQERLVEHNSNYSKHAGRIVKETGQKWELKTYIAVPDPNWAETVYPRPKRNPRRCRSHQPRRAHPIRNNRPLYG